MHDVVIVGAGPTGLMAACELALAGVSCTILDKRDSESNVTRAFGLHARALELLDARGMGDELVAGGNPLRTVYPAYASRVDFGRLDTRYPMLLLVPQNGTEKLLQQRAAELGVQIRRNARVVGLGLEFAYPPGEPDAHPLAGRRAADGPTDTGRLYEVLRAGTFVLLSDKGVPTSWRNRVRAARPLDGTRPEATLIRPDGYVAWAGDHAGIEAALVKWCGPADHPNGEGNHAAA
ncbi:FAD-dependent oxidoreductase [Nonomuraea dietziae]|uniref:FAD-dependent oxidoreductase n=1 Tax=Nonomuraea dietziae TaxID=65515 RepID=UPI00343B8097